jgi:hypothetical protein
VTRGGTVLALVLLLSLGLTPAAAGGTRTADVFLKERGDDYFAGEDLLSADGAGQSRSLIVEDDLVVIVKVQNDGDDTATFSVEASEGEDGFRLRYLSGGEDVTDDVVAGDLSLDIPAGKKRSIRVEVDATDAEFAAVQLVLVSAVSGDGEIDAARAEVTKIS